MLIFSDISSQVVAHLPRDCDENTIIFEIELLELARQKPLNYEPQIQFALEYAEKGDPVVILCDQEYTQYEAWNRLVSMNNVSVCFKSELTKLASIVKSKGPE